MSTRFKQYGSRATSYPLKQGFRWTVYRRIVHRRLVIGKLELLAQASHEAIEEGLPLLVMMYIMIYNVHPDKVNNILLFYFLSGIASTHLEK